MGFLSYLVCGYSSSARTTIPVIQVQILESHPTGVAWSVTWVTAWLATRSAFQRPQRRLRAGGGLGWGPAMGSEEGHGLVEILVETGAVVRVGRWVAASAGAEE